MPPHCYSTTSTDPLNGWKLVGNPYTCNGYLMFGDAVGNMINATFYKMNAAGNGYDKYENYVMLAPGEGAFVKYNTSGKVWYYSEDQGWTIASSGTAILPILPMHGLSTSQDASNYNIVLADNATDNSATVDAYIFVEFEGETIGNSSQQKPSGEKQVSLWHVCREEAEQIR